MLEGPPAAIDKLYETISSDNRHDEILKLRDTACSRRLFASWAMKNDEHQSWMLSRSELTKFGPDEALSLFERLARENDQFLQ